MGDNDEQKKIQNSNAGKRERLFLASAAFASIFDIPGGDMKSALDSYTTQSGIELVYPEDAIK